MSIPDEESLHHTLIRKPLEIIRKKAGIPGISAYDESFELLNQNLPENDQAVLSRMGCFEPPKKEEDKNNEDIKSDVTVQSEYEPKLPQSEQSLDSPREYLRCLRADPSKDRIIDDISFSHNSNETQNKASIQKPTFSSQPSGKKEEILQRSEIQALQNKREEALKKPLVLNIMIVGASSLGKTTFIDVFLSNKFERVAKIRPPTTDIFETTARIKFGEFAFILKMIDTPGFVHGTNISKYYRNLKKNLTERFAKFKKSQTRREKRDYFQSRKSSIVKEIPDERIHLVLYFASAPRVNSHDLFLMKKLQKYCSIIPVIAKGDCFTPEEIKEIKTEFIKSTMDEGIEFFDCASALDSPEKLSLLKEGPFGPCPPFLIISSLEKIEVEPSKFVYCRLLIGQFSLELINLTEFYYKAYWNHKQEKKRKLREAQQKYKIGFGIVTFVLGAIYFKKSMN